MPLTPHHLLLAYSQGIFPMADGDRLLWYDPDPRAILPLDGLHIPKRLARTLRQQPFEIRIDGDFEQTMRHCAKPAPRRESTWISEAFVQVYGQLHAAGFAHSVECWQDGQLVGGLYGVTLGGLFAGESMFSVARDASKVALVALVERMRARGYVLLDTQFTTPHLVRFGVIEIPRADYQHRLAHALTIDAQFV